MPWRKVISCSTVQQHTLVLHASKMGISRPAYLTLQRISSYHIIWYDTISCVLHYVVLHCTMLRYATLHTTVACYITVSMSLAGMSAYMEVCVCVYRNVIVDIVRHDVCCYGIPCTLRYGVLWYVIIWWARCVTLCHATFDCVVCRALYYAMHIIYITKYTMTYTCQHIYIYIYIYICVHV